MKGKTIRISDYLLLQGTKVTEDERACIYILTEKQNNKRTKDANCAGALFKDDEGRFVFTPMQNSNYYSETLGIVAGILEALNNNIIQYDKITGEFDYANSSRDNS